MDDAKRCLAPGRALSEWSAAGRPCAALCVELDGAAVVVRRGDGGSVRLLDNVHRVAVASFESAHGDDLPFEPVVLTGCCTDWAALYCECGWSVAALARRGLQRAVSLDGGPGFARTSLSLSRVPIQEYHRYCSADADGDRAPLYVFDADVLSSGFADGTTMASEWATPHCFSHDAQAGLTGSTFRPLPPAWLLVGAARSGTPIHDHPTTASWNALLSGAKAWVILPPDVDEAELLLRDDDDDDDDGSGDGADGGALDLSALEWFGERAERPLPAGARIVMQCPGEVVYVPAGWWHVVLNVQTSTALSVSLALRRDIDTLLPKLLKEDQPFAMQWLRSLGRDLPPSLKDALTLTHAPESLS